MRLGLVTDIHNRAAELSAALSAFRARGVDRVITMGDTCVVFDRGGGSTAVAALLADCSAVGVWGNHDFTLCRKVPSIVREHYPPAVLHMMARMEPRLLIADCYFTHKESAVDPHDVSQLWDIANDGPVDLMEKARLAFAAVNCKWQFFGHYHRWWAATPSGPIDWAIGEPLQFKPGPRYFVVVAPVCEGWCAILDTKQWSLEPIRCGPIAPSQIDALEPP